MPRLLPAISSIGTFLVPTQQRAGLGSAPRIAGTTLLIGLRQLGWWRLTSEHDVRPDLPDRFAAAICCCPSESPFGSIATLFC